jgi:hypothetical protein
MPFDEHAASIGSLQLAFSKQLQFPNLPTALQNKMERPAFEQISSLGQKNSSF